ncbi:hypothetical protein LG204_10260 [Methylovorus menthalis]|uniref:hypothetical protein n=1 Tax=Methylovorus menthalis TaxID=1002227 RepID=UPI001E50BA2A|nr:hypothetical protein [Methylovorus menthalis]MCB4811697.1 hypothetical protein [Methylovorus menthalis]
MAFCLAVNEFYFHPVVVFMQDDKGGFTPSKFVVKFRRVPLPEMESIKALTGKELVQSVVIGWKDLHDEEGNEVEFSEEHLDQLISIGPAFSAVYDAFWDSQFKAKAKN